MVNKYLCCTIFSASFGAFVAATVIGWSSPMTEQLGKIDDNPLGRPITRSENSWLASISTLGSCISCIAFGVLSSYFGRKPLLISTGVLFSVFYLVMAFSKSIYLLYLGRLVTGAGAGGILTILPHYSAEISEAKNRGMITTINTIFLNFGMLYSLIAGPHMQFLLFHVSLAVISAFFSFILWIFAPESPYVLIKSNRLEAKKVLEKLRRYENVDESLEQIETSVVKDTSVSWKEIIHSKASVKTIIIGLGGFTFIQLVGASIVLAYSETIFKEAGGSFNPEDGPIIITIVQLITSLILPVYADKFPRKLLLMLGFAGVGLAQIPLGAYFYLKMNDHSVNGLSLLPLACMMSISFLHSVIITPVLMTIMGEIFPPRIKNAVVSWLVAYNLVGGFLITLLFNTFEDALGIDYLFWIAAFFGFVAAIFVKCCVFETRGKSLQEIQDELNRK